MQQIWAAEELRAHWILSDAELGLLKGMSERRRLTLCYDQEISVLSLHLLQASMVYVNTLMIQDVLEDRVWREKMTTRDMAALNPLPYSHINPYGVFDLDMSTRLPLNDKAAAA